MLLVVHNTLKALQYNMGDSQIHVESKHYLIQHTSPTSLATKFPCVSILANGTPGMARKYTLFPR